MGRILLIVISCIIAGCSRSQEEIRFFCGAGARLPMDEVIKEYHKDRGINVWVTYMGAGHLLSQMETSRSGDVFLAGSSDFIAIGEKKGLLIKGTNKIVAYFVPAIIVPRGNPANVHSLEDLTRKGIRIGMGNPEVFAVGAYWVEILDTNNLLERVLPNILVYTKSAEDLASLAVLRKVDAVLGWVDFKFSHPDDVDLVEIEPSSIPRISCIEIAIPVFVRDKVLAEDFIRYVLSEKGMAIFKKWGYITEEKLARRYAPNARIGGECKLPEKYFNIIKGKK